MSKIGYCGLIVALCVVCYFLGQANCQSVTLQQQINVKKHSQKQIAKIYAAPNAKRDALLELMRGGRL